VTKQEQQAPFTLDGFQHSVGDAECPDCWEAYPRPHACGGLMHAAYGGEEGDRDEWLYTRCDRCGESE